jgi:hypothetical protein
MELVGYRFFFLVTSLVLLILAMVAPYLNIEADISGYAAEAMAGAYLEQYLRLQVMGAVAVACILVEFAELFCAVSLLLRPWHVVSTVLHMFQTFLLTWYIIGGWPVWVFELTCVLFNVLPAVATATILLAVFWQDVGTLVNRCLL